MNQQHDSFGQVLQSNSSELTSRVHVRQLLAVGLAGVVVGWFGHSWMGGKETSPLAAAAPPVQQAQVAAMPLITEPTRLPVATVTPSFTATPSSIPSPTPTRTATPVPTVEPLAGKVALGKWWKRGGFQLMVDAPVIDPFSWEVRTHIRLMNNTTEPRSLRLSRDCFTLYDSAKGRWSFREGIAVVDLMPGKTEEREVAINIAHDQLSNVKIKADFYGVELSSDCHPIIGSPKWEDALHH